MLERRMTVPMEEALVCLLPFEWTSSEGKADIDV